VSGYDVDGLNAGYASLLLDEYLENPEGVPAEWRELFESGDSALVASLPGLARLLELRGGNGDVAAPAPPAAPAQPVDDVLLGGVAAAMALIKAHRMHGHLGARLDPLGSEPVGDPALEPERLEPKLTPELQARIPTSVLRVHVEGETLAEALPRLQETYCGTIAYEIEHISAHEERVWLRQAIESGRFRAPLSADERRRLLARLSEVEGLERYLRRAFLGQKQFSIEGLDAMVPMLDEAIELAAADGAHEVVIGMAHRGRLNVLAHTVGHPYEQILREFEGERTLEAVSAYPEGGTGDVKYHLGARGTLTTETGKIGVTVCANPSHLEAVDPVVVGRTRAEQTDRGTASGEHDPSVALALLLHGDTAFPGQGVVAETLNLEALRGYSTGGTLHVITNNQVGFTTNPDESRSTRYSSDLAKGFDIPIIHVNADDPEAAIASVRLALSYRRRFGKDVVVDLIGYRRFGHNEQDEAAYTQPVMVEQIAGHPTVRELYAATLVEAGVVTQEEADELARAAEASLRRAHEALKASFGQAIPAKTKDERIPRGADNPPITTVPEERLRALNAELLRVPEGFTVHPKLAKQLERRVTALDAGGIDWGHAESLAFSSLLVDGIPVRLTGQDTERGTFSQRHMVLHDVHTGETWAPIQHLAESAASMEVHNSPLSEYGCVGFEYGYSSRGARGARLLGGPVRRLRQRRPDHPRPVLLGRPLEMGPDDAADAAPAARVRGERSRALERAARAVPPARRPGEHPHRELHHRGAVLPPAPPAGARRQRPAARRDDAEGAPAAEGGLVDARRAGGRRLRPGDRRRDGRQGRRAPARPLHGQGLLRPRRPRGACRGGDGRGRAASSRSTRFRSKPRASSSPPTRASTRSCGCRRSRRTWAPGGRRATASRRQPPGSRSAT